MAGQPGRPRKATRSQNTPAPPAQPAAEASEASPDDLPQRRSRRRFGAMSYKLGVEPIPGHVQRWINDIPGRIAYAEECGYTKVTDDKGKPIYRVVGVSPNGGELRAYRMKIPREWYEEDQAEKQAEIDALDEDIKNGTASRIQPGQEGGYVPTRPDGRSRIEVTHSVGRDNNRD